MPHVVARTDGPLKTFVVVGAGPGGLEAARVAAARGHKVVLLEAADQPGGQVRVAAGLARRREILGVIDWRVAECERLGVELRCNVYAEADDVLREAPDVVIVATGGVPNLDFLLSGAEHAVSSWDILTGAVKPAANVLVYDDNGAHPGVSVAEFCARAGANVDYMTPERTMGPDVGSTSFPPYLRAFSQFDVGVTLNLRLESLRREGNRLVATFHDEYGRKRVERIADQVVVDHGATPVDELYFALKAGSRNLGEVDQAALIAARPQTLIRNAEGAYQLFRIGDAVASRNIHAAIYDALRLVCVL
jgi:NADPH-dependent 2,4-dienoyl-CoA reductase/sulfur reductase-like enzyme